MFLTKPSQKDQRGAKAAQARADATKELQPDYGKNYATWNGEIKVIGSSFVVIDKRTHRTGQETQKAKEACQKHCNQSPNHLVFCDARLGLCAHGFYVGKNNPSQSDCLVNGSDIHWHTVATQEPISSGWYVSCIQRFDSQSPLRWYPDIALDPSTFLYHDQEGFYLSSCISNTSNNESRHLTTAKYYFEKPKERKLMCTEAQIRYCPVISENQVVSVRSYSISIYKN